MQYTWRWGRSLDDLRRKPGSLISLGLAMYMELAT